MDCIFCKIANHEISANVVFENENIIAFEDLNPVAKVHVLVVPKKHIDSVIKIENEEANYIVEIHKVIKEVAKLKGIDETGFRVITNCGDDGGQTVKHLHYHVIGGEKLAERLV